MPGLAHFLEHLISKEMKMDGSSDFFSSHQGQLGALTAGENTSFFFELAADHLEAALDRFVQPLIQPLFKLGSLENEVQELNLEYEMGLANNQKRINQLQRSLANPNHPYSNFGEGNLQSLYGVSPEAVTDFYRRHYSANLMRLVVYGRESLDELQGMVVSKFSPIPSHNFVLPLWPDEPLQKEHFQKIIHVRSIENTQVLYLTWLLADLEQYSKTKPATYYSYLISHKGKGGILSSLKQKGWALDVKAGINVAAQGFSIFQITVDLSQEGLDNYNEVIATIFRYIKMLQQEGPKYEIHEEIRKMGELKFIFLKEEFAMNFCLSKAGDMHIYGYPYRDLLTAPYIAREYNADDIKAFGEALKLTNFRAIFLSTDPICGFSAELEPWYGTEYCVRDYDEEFFQELDVPYQAEGNPNLHLPKLNAFIPEYFRVKMPLYTMTGPRRLQPDLLVNNERFKLWHKQDDTFALPKGTFLLILRPSPNWKSLENLVKIDLIKELVNNALEEHLEEARQVGLSFLISHSIRGVEMVFSGYDAKLSDFIAFVLQCIKNLVIDPRHFEVVKGKYRSYLTEEIYEDPSFLLLYYMGGILERESLWHWQKAAVLETIQHEHVQAFLPELFGQGNLEFLCHGNYFAEEAIQIAQMVWEQLQPNPLQARAPFGISAVKLPEGQPIIFFPEYIPGTYSGIVFYLQIGSMENVQHRVLSRLFKEIFKTPYADMFHIYEELGYCLLHTNVQIGSSIGLSFMLQTPKDLVESEGDIESFIAMTGEIIQSMSDGAFKEHVDLLSSILLEGNLSMSHEAMQYWDEIVSEQYDFQKNQTDAKYLQTLTKADMLDFIRQYILPNAPSRRQLSVHIWSRTQFKKLRKVYAELSKEDVWIFSDPADIGKHFESFPILYSTPTISSTEMKVLE